MKAKFTLIELLIIISIILIALLLPVLSKVKEKSKRTICTSNIRQLTMGSINYSADYNKRLPARHSQASLYPAGHHDDRSHATNDWGIAFNYVFEDYDYNEENPSSIFFCPSQEYSPEEIWFGISNQWRFVDYFYWGWSDIRMGAWGSSWRPERVAPRSLSDSAPSDPLFGDAIMTGSYISYNHAYRGSSGSHYVSN